MTSQHRHSAPEASSVERLLVSIDRLRRRPSSKSAHSFRTSFRRFQAWQDVVRPKLNGDKKEALKFLKKLRKATGKLRDSEVHLELLDQLDSASSKEKKKVERALKARRSSAHKKLEALLSDSEVKHHLTNLRMVGEPPMASLQASPLHAADQLALDQYRAFVESRAPISPDNLHSYRLACKAFRYTAELAGATPQARALLDAWKTIQDASGEWHDYVVLSELTEEVCGDCSLHSLLIGLRDQKFDQSVSAVESLERKLLSSAPVGKKRPGNVRKGRRSAAVA